MSIFAWIPFLEPMQFMQGVWYLLAIPLLLGISMAHKGMRLPASGPWMRSVAVMTLQALLGLIALSLAIVLLVRLVVPAV